MMAVACKPKPGRSVSFNKTKVSVVTDFFSEELKYIPCVLIVADFNILWGGGLKPCTSASDDVWTS
jgi:hypothetical protein